MTGLVRYHRLAGAEIVHHLDDELTVTSHHRTVQVQNHRLGREESITLPSVRWKTAAGSLRIARRLLRLDKCNVVAVAPHGNAFVIVREGMVYHCDLETGFMNETLQLEFSRNALHCSFANIGGRELFFGEYGHNPELRSVPVYHSTDGGRSWTKVFEFPRGKTRHVHACYWDEVEGKVWVFSGDFDGEPWVVVANRTFEDVEWLGDGSQTYRAISAFFTEDSVYWLMDSPLQVSRLVRLDRASRTVEVGMPFPGPVWYGKTLSDGMYLTASAAEPGPALQDNFAHVYASQDLETWSEIARFRKDRLHPKYFKIGVVGFAEGKQTSERFALHAEALSGIDGQAWICRLGDSGTGPTAS